MRREQVPMGIVPLSAVAVDVLLPVGQGKEYSEDVWQR